MFSSLVLAAAIGGLAWTAVRLLSRPIPIAIEGGLQVDRLVLPPTVTIDVAAPLPVRVSDAVSVSGDVRADARLSGIDSPVSVAPITVTPITVAPVSVDGAVTVKETVRIDFPMSSTNLTNIGNRLAVDRHIGKSATRSGAVD